MVVVVVVVVFSSGGGLVCGGGVGWTSGFTTGGCPGPEVVVGGGTTTGVPVGGGMTTPFESVVPTGTLVGALPDHVEDDLDPEGPVPFPDAELLLLPPLLFPESLFFMLMINPTSTPARMVITTPPIQ